MKCARLLLAALFGLCGAAFAAEPSGGLLKPANPAAPDTRPAVLEPVVAGVWFCEDPTRNGCNNIVIEMTDYLIVVDANYPSGARAVIDATKKLSDKPIKYVINTHHHPDHMYGNPIFTRIGAITIGHVGVLEEMKRYEPQSWQGVARVRKDVGELHLAAPEPPRQTYTDSPYVITDGARRVELYHFTFGHTRSDTFVYLPKEKVLCTGDAVVNGPFSDPKHAWMANWPNEIRAAQKLDVEHVLPGHGKAGGKELLQGEIEFFEALYQAVEAEVKAGKKLEDLVTMKDGRAMATTVSLPRDIMDKYVFRDPKQPWQIARFPTQVMCTFEEIKQGKPYGEIAGGK